MGKVFTPPAITVCNEKVNRSYPQAKDGYPQEVVDKSGYQQGVVDCVDKSMSTYSLHPLFKQTVCDGVRGWALGQVIGALVASGDRTVLCKSTGWMKPQERNHERNTKTRAGHER
jgi:hypothetical protein